MAGTVSGERFGAYRLDDPIGRGGMGVVYRAEHEHLGRTVALKLLAPEVAAAPTFRARFLRESRLAASLDHPNVVPVYDAGEVDGTLYIAMRYVRGTDLADVLRAEGPLDLARVLGLLTQVASALDAAHALGLIHRDIKPANVLIEGERCYLTDFGLTKEAAGATPLTRTGEVIGTVAYMSPELIEGRPVDGRADVYALACVLYECLVGTPPFPRESYVAVIYAHMSERPPRPSQARPELSSALDGVVARAMAKRPAERYASCGEMASAASAAVTGVERIYQLAQPLLPDRPPPLRPRDDLRHNLPNHLTSLVGRERELSEVLALLGESRLLTLSGVGGCGKTRLAVQAATEALERFPDGVRLVELAPLGDASLVTSHVAAAVGLSDAAGVAGTLDERLAEVLATERMLLVLDNCEHVIAAVAAVVKKLLQRSDHLAFLVTSREPLSVPGEQVWPVPPLGRDDAVALFLARARAVAPAFSAEENREAIRRICERLDGIPLALELAAARVRHLPPGEIAARLENSFDLLSSGARTAVPRHQTLQAALDWSHDLLDPSERALFRRASVFAGGWTLAAAETICPAHPLAQEAVFDLLGALVDKSLVVVDISGDASRYRLLEPVRQYAAQRLARDGDPREAERLRQRHCDWCLSIARDAVPKMLTRSRHWLGRVIAPERDNFRAGLEYSATAPDTDMLLRFIAALFPFWVNGGHVGEGRRWAGRALLLQDVGSPRLRARVMDTAGELAQYQCDYDDAIALHRHALEIWQEHGGRGRAFSLLGLGRALTFQGHATGAAPLEESLALAVERGAFSLAGLCHTYLATRDFLLGDLRRADERLSEALVLAERVNDPGLSGMLLVHRGAIAALTGDLPAGRSLCDRALLILDEDGDRFAQYWGCDWATSVALLGDDYVEARRLVARSFRLTRESGAYETLQRTLCYAAVLAATDARHEAAAVLWAAAESIGTKTHVASQWRHAFSALEREPRAETERMLDEETLHHAQSAGGAMSIEHAISLGLEQTGKS